MYFNIYMTWFIQCHKVCRFFMLRLFDHNIMFFVAHNIRSQLIETWKAINCTEKWIPMGFGVPINIANDSCEIYCWWLTTTKALLSTTDILQSYFNIYVVVSNKSSPNTHVRMCAIIINVIICFIINIFFPSKSWLTVRSLKLKYEKTYTWY